MFRLCRSSLREPLQQKWRQLLGTGPDVPALVVLPTPYSSLIDPFCDYVMEREAKHPERNTTVVMPMVLPRDRLEGLLLNQRAVSLYKEPPSDRSRVFCVVRSFIG